MGSAAARRPCGAGVARGARRPACRVALSRPPGRFPPARSGREADVPGMGPHPGLSRPDHPTPGATPTMSVLLDRTTPSGSAALKAPIASAVDVVKRYGAGESAVDALAGVSVDLERGA